MSALGLAGRLARREVRRRPGRTALVTLLVAVPVAGMVLSLVLFRTDRLSPDEQWQRDNGDADAVLFDNGAPGEAIDTATLPEGSRVVILERWWTRVRTADGVRSDLSVWGLEADDPMVDGRLDLVAGRLPAAGDEVAFDPDLAETFGVGVGDRIALERPDAQLDVVGLVEDPTDLHADTALTVPGGDLLSTDPANPPQQSTLVDLPAGASVEALAGPDTFVMTRDSPPPPGPRTEVPWTFVLGAVVLTVVGIVISAAFAAGARRQLVMLGQLSANGAAGPVLRATLVLQGTVTGLVGAAVGIGIAAAALLAGRSSIEQLVGHRLDRYDVSVPEIGGAVAIGVAAATVAALVPAWSIARIPTLTALAGRRPLPPVRHRVTVAGGLAAALGLGLLGLAVLGSATGEDSEIWALVAITGGVLELLGACAVAPAVVAHLEPLAGRTRGAWRLASRSLARQRARTGAVVSAVAAAAGLALGATALVMGMEAGEAALPELSDQVVMATEIAFVEDLASPRGGYETHVPPDATAQAELTRILPGAEQVTIRTAGEQDDWPDLRVPVVADAAVLDAFDLGDDVRDALADDGVVAIGRQEEGPGAVTLPDGQVHDVTTVSSDHNLGSVWSVLVTPALVDRLGVQPRDAGLVYVDDGLLSSQQVDDVETFRDDSMYDKPATSTTYLDVSVRIPETGPTPVQIELILAGVALVFAILVVGASLALAAAESRDERDVLTVVGVAPGTLARSSGAKAWLLAAIGAVMAVPVGLLPVAVFAGADDGTMRFVVPWRALGLLALVLPVIVAGIALATSAAAQRLRPVRVSTAVFD